MSRPIAKEPIIVDDATKLAQHRAADPRASAWVSANAGAGKTKVLSDRVLRLLLAGTPPARILCLTFTKAAAANMAIRVFDRLGAWVTLPEAALKKELIELEGAEPSRDHLRRARCLFARAVETPGGLKIETIHAFCERLLHLVPFEANVPARFTVLDETQVEEQIAQAMKAVLAEAAREETPELAQAFARVGLDAAGEGLAAVVAAAVKAIKCDRLPAKLSTCTARLRATLGLAPDETVEAIERGIVGLSPDALRGFIDALRSTSSSTDRDLAEAIAGFLASDNKVQRLRLYRCIFFTEDGAGTPRARLGTKAVPQPVRDALASERDRLTALCEKLKSADAVERTAALYTLAGAIVKRVELHKQRIGALDFDDLIAKTLALLSRGDGAWVLYKLDRGIDHVLLDEAQDTNPEQWQILRHLTEDFASGRGASERQLRTVFAVGDPKQSIYSFQGAAPREFEASSLYWEKRTKDAELRFESVRLTLSFRSAKAVLSAVDRTFAEPSHFKGLAFGDSAVGTVHESARPHAPGCVELWPMQEPEQTEEPEAWVLPVDEPDRQGPPVLVAARVAKAVRQWTTRGDESGRVWSPGDILVLVRKRGAAFEAVIRALKGAGVPVAGADRIDIGEHIAVADLVAAGRAALLPEDDLTVATALKSPLVGLTDDDLIRIAGGRDGAESLIGALRRHAAADDEAARRACEALQTWRELARAHGPFGFFASLLGPLGGRRKLVARLGNEAGDAIDAFLSFAHSAEAVETPSLTTFLSRFESASHEVKRDLDALHEEVRVMTVHGAKGLEAPVVVLIDGCDLLGQDPPLIPVGLDGTNAEFPVWSPGAKHDPPRVRAARDKLRARALEEHNRLLYVAMTRAKDRLVIAPFRTTAKEAPVEAWCQMVRRSLAGEAGALVLTEMPHGPVDLWRDDNPWPPLPAAAPVEQPCFELLPRWLTTPAAPEAEPAPAIRPSHAAPQRSLRRLGAVDPAMARLRGSLVHGLLERLPGLPAERRGGAAEAYLRARAPRLGEAERGSIVADALRVLGHDELAGLFAPGSRAEVGIAGTLVIGGEARPVSGQIDRLAVSDGEVLVADFKSDARVPGPGRPAPEPYVTQLALYRHLLREIHPGRPVRAFLVWTAGPSIQELRPEELDQALDRLTAP